MKLYSKIKWVIPLKWTLQSLVNGVSFILKNYSFKLRTFPFLNNQIVSILRLRLFSFTLWVTFGYDFVIVVKVTATHPLFQYITSNCILKLLQFFFMDLEHILCFLWVLLCDLLGQLYLLGHAAHQIIGLLVPLFHSFQKLGSILCTNLLQSCNIYFFTFFNKLVDVFKGFVLDLSLQHILKLIDFPFANPNRCILNMNAHFCIQIDKVVVKIRFLQSIFLIETYEFILGSATAGNYFLI